jgi:hypothetical protein
MGRKHRKPSFRDKNIYVRPDIVPVLFALKGTLETDLFQGEELFELEEPIAGEISAYYSGLVEKSSNEEIEMVPVLVRMLYLGEFLNDILDKFLVEGIAAGFDPKHLKVPIAGATDQWEWYSNTINGQIWSYATFGIPFLTIRTGSAKRHASADQLLQLPVQAPPKMTSLIRRTVNASQPIAIGVGGHAYDFRSDFVEIYAQLLWWIVEQESKH